MSFLANQLRELRGNKTLYQVQQETGLPRITVSRYERGENTPSILNLKKLSNYYGCDYKELRMLYYNDVLTDEEERIIVLTWALKHLLPETNLLNLSQLECVVTNPNPALANSLEQLLLQHFPNHQS